MSNRSLNGLSNVFVNTLNSGDGINIVSSSSTSQSTINLDISKQSAKTSLDNTDIFVLEESDGSIKKVSYQNLESNIDTNFWTYSAPSLRPNNTTDNILIGTSSNSDSRKLIVFGDSELGDVYMPTDKKLISKNDSNDFIKFGNNVITISATGGSLITGGNLVLGSSTDIILSAGGVGISRAGSSTDKIYFNSGNFTFGNSGIFNNSVQVKSTDDANSGSVSFFEAKDNGTNNIDLHCPLITTHDYNAYLPKITDTNITSVYILSNRNVLPGTNINITNGTTDTITVNLDTSLTGLTSITSTNAILDGLTVNTNPIQVKGTNSTRGLVNFYDNGETNHISLQTATSLGGSSYDLILPSIDDTLITKISSDVLENKTMGNNTIFSVTPTFNATLRCNGATGLPAQILMYTTNGLNFINLKSPNTLSGDFTLTLPAVDGTLLSDQDTIPINKGGTNLTSYTTGDILYASATNTLSKLAIGSANTFLVSNGSNVSWSAGLSFTSPLSKNGTTIDLGNLSGFGTNNQILATNGSDALEYRTLTEGSNITITNTSSSITINSVNYWERNSNVSSFDIKTTNTVDNIALTVPLSTDSTFVSTSSLKSTLGLISGGGEYLKFIDYSGTKPLELKGILNSSTQRTYHMAFKHDSTGTSYPLLAQDIDGHLYFHWNALGDKFTFRTNGDSLMSSIISPTSANEECFLGFGSTVLTNTFHRTDLVKLKVAPNSSYAAGTEPGFIELVESAATSSNTTRLYFNSAGTAFIFWDGTNLINTPSFAPSDMRLKKNETLANTAELSNAFDNIEIYKYQYEEQYAIDKGADPDKYVFGFIAQNVKENTDNLSSQFSCVGKGQAIYPNNEIDYEGDKLEVDNVLTINKTDMNLLLWGKMKEMDAIIKNQQKIINNLINATSFKDFKTKQNI